jgi:cellulose synthase/poly-beta-1,6-N-acetylglucosamine synthase-like glycosyltransferase
MAGRTLADFFDISGPAEWFLLIALLCYFPFAVYQLYLMDYSMYKTDKKGFFESQPLKAANNLIVVITTNGMATDVVEKIIAKTKLYESASEIFVIKEARDPFRYSCREIVVPEDYVCPNGSRNKMRALHYGSIVLHDMGYGEETYICHLDDDSVVDRPYLEYIRLYMTGGGGQGCIMLRAWGRHLFSSLADIIRISNCEAWCKRRNHKGKPQFVHGEGLVVRADVEYEIGWDYGTYGAEDLIMGLNIAKKWGFGYIPVGHIYIAPPTSVRDFYKQRRRWFWSLLNNKGVVRRLSFGTWALYMYMYVNSIMGLFSLLMLPFFFVFADGLSGFTMLIAMVNILNFYAYYQFGATHLRSISISAMMFLLTVPVSFYEGITSIYALVRPPDFTTFETIKKVRFARARPAPSPGGRRSASWTRRRKRL